MNAKDKLLTVGLFAGGLTEFKEEMTDQFIDKQSGKIKDVLLPASSGSPKETEALTDKDLDDIINEISKTDY